MDINARNIATPAADAPTTQPASVPTPVVGRFAPSPSGRMHLGNVFSCLCAWLSARSQGGSIVLRIEDLDDRCKRPELAAQLIDDLAWLGLEWDEGPYYQHDRLDLYESALRQLQDASLTYPCFCTRAELHAASAPHASDGTPIYRGACRNLSAKEIARRSALRAPATRLRVPTVDDLADDVIEFVDRTYGAQCEALATECGDFLVRRSDGVFAYQLAVVVDDAAMGITEIVRGCDLLGSRRARSICSICWDCPRRTTRTFRCSCHRTAAVFPSAIAIWTWASSVPALARPRRCWAGSPDKRASRRTPYRVPPSNWLSTLAGTSSARIGKTSLWMKGQTCNRRQPTLTSASITTLPKYQQLIFHQRGSMRFAKYLTPLCLKLRKRYSSASQLGSKSLSKPILVRHEAQTPRPYEISQGWSSSPKRTMQS